MRWRPPLWERLALAAIVLTILAAVLVVIHETFRYAGWWEMLVLVVLAAFGWFGTRKAIGLLRGTVHHRDLSTVPSTWWMSEEGGRAFYPSLVFACDAAAIAYGALLFDGGDGPVTLPIAVVACLVCFGFGLTGLCAGWFRRPRCLLPATMRPR